MDEARREALLDELLDNLGTRAQLLLDAQLNLEDSEHVEELLRVSDAIWSAAQAPPALADDPVAAMLGLVPDSECQLSPAALTRARKTARLSVGDIAKQLRERGWQFGSKDIFRWETRTATDVPPAVIQALADTLHATVSSLIVDLTATATLPAASPLRESPRFAALVDRWAAATRVSRSVAAAALESRSLATVHRGEHPDTEQLLATLDALVSAVERNDSEHRDEP